VKEISFRRYSGELCIPDLVDFLDFNLISSIWEDWSCQTLDFNNFLVFSSVSSDFTLIKIQCTSLALDHFGAVRSTKKSGKEKKKEKEKFKNWVSTISRRMREWERRKKKRKRKRKRKKERKRNENENGNVRNWKEPWSWENKFPPLPKFNLGDWVYSVQWDE